MKIILDGDFNNKQKKAIENFIKNGDFSERKVEQFLRNRMFTLIFDFQNDEVVAKALR